MLTSSPLLDLVRAGAFVMLVFAAILLSVVIRNLEAPIRFGTRSGPIAVGLGLILFAIPIYGQVAGIDTLTKQGSLMRILAAFVLPIGLYLMRPLAPGRHQAPPEEPDES